MSGQAISVCEQPDSRSGISVMSIVAEPSSGSTSEPTVTGIVFVTPPSISTAILSVAPDCSCSAVATRVVFVTSRMPPSATATVPSPMIAPKYSVDCATVKVELELIKTASAARLSLLTNVTFSSRKSSLTVTVPLLKDA